MSLVEKFEIFGSKLKDMLSDNSADILLGIGIVGVVGGTVTACVATLKSEKIKKEADELIDSMDEEEDQKEIKAVVRKEVGGIALQYSIPTVILGTSIFCICKSHAILNDRLVKMSTAYAALLASYNDYRRRVEEKIGKEENDKIIKDQLKDSYDDSGNRISSHPASPFMFMFNQQTSSEWYSSLSTNLSVLQTRQEAFQRIYNVKERLYLKDVLEELGMFDRLTDEEKDTATTCGWDKRLDGDGFIDFGIIIDIDDDLHNSVILNFNCDGTIYGIKNKERLLCQKGRKH